MRTPSKGKKTAKRRLMKELNWGRKKWKTRVPAPRRPSMERRPQLQRSLGTRGGSRVQDSVDGAALAGWDGNGSCSFSSFNSLVSLSSYQYDPGDSMGAEELLSVDHQTSQAEGGLSVDHQTSQGEGGPPLDYHTVEAEGITRGAILQIYTGGCGSIMAQELDEVTSDETELAPTAQMLITDSGLETLPTADENVEDSLHVEVSQHSRGDALDVSRPPFNRENQAEVNREIQEASSNHEMQVSPSHEIQASLNHGAQVAINQGAEASLNQGTQAALNHGARAALNHGAQAALNHGARAALNHGAQAALNHGPQAIPNQGNIVIEQEVAEAGDIGIGNPPRSYVVHIPNGGFRLRYQYQPLTRDVDLRAERHYISLARLSYRSLQKCATCFQRPRQALNLPCRCLCNCLNCDRVMFLCSVCQRPIWASVRCGLRR